METGTGTGGPPASVEEALARARRHARLAAAEGLAALRALLDAAALAATGSASDEVRAIRSLGQRLDATAAALRAGSGGADALVGALAEALEAEIARWQARSAEDPDARAVLRAFLGLRELLWELGVRPRAPGRAAAGAPREPAEAPRAEAAARVRSAPRGSEGPRPGPRVQRIPVEG